MRARVQIIFLACVLVGLLRSARAETMVSITQHHNNSSRDGLYIEPAITQATAANLQRDLAFDGTIAGHVLTTGEEIRDGHVRVECDVDAVNKSFIPAQHGLAGALEIEIERLSPAALVLRLAGEWIAGTRPSSKQAQ